MRPVGILGSPVCCKTPTQLVQLLSRVWKCSELWHLHHANWSSCISMWTSLCCCAMRVCFQVPVFRTRIVCVGESEWPRVLFSGLWLFGGQSWCGPCLREWIYHLQPYIELHPLSWLFLSPFYLFLFVHQELLHIYGNSYTFESLYSSYTWAHFYCEIRHYLFL